MTVSFAALAEKAEEIAALARQIADAEAERAATLVGFRKHSAARHAAGLLLDHTGSWLSRSEIAAATGCQPNAVVAVVARLRDNGVPVERRTVDGHAEFRVPPSEGGAA